jgi:DNA-binding winged helix-turn-helix (wHTH) protein
MESKHFESLYPESSRFEDIEKLLEFIKQGKSCQLVSIPGAGRSNLLGLLAYNTKIRIKHLGENQKWFHFVYVNLSEVKDKPLFDLNKLIFLSIADSLKDRGLKKEHDFLHKIFKEHLAFNDGVVLFQGLKEAIDFLTIEKELTIVLLLDRFEAYLQILTSDFFNQLRTLRNRAKYRFSVIFSLTHPLEELIEPHFLSDFYEFVEGNIVYLSLLDKPGIEFRISYFEKLAHKSFDKQLIDQLIELTGGHGKLIKTCVEELSTSKKKHTSTQDLSKFLIDQKNVKAALYEIWYSLSPSEQDALINKSYENKYLKDIGLFRGNKITIPIFENFISSLDVNSFKKIVFDPTKNEITSGNLVLSDNLTGSEFMLLKFLLQNEGKTIEREELINNVWKNTKSVEGVTDQALDQLIFRLRKKIENNPNNPSHILTIKGIGIKFIS